MGSDTTPPPHAELIPPTKGVDESELQALRARGNQTVYRGPACAKLGMPIGGIGAGQLYLLGDGRLGCWWIDGALNFTGFGADSYGSALPVRPVAQGVALHVRTGQGVTHHADLSDADFDAIEFVGEYPRARVRYRGGKAAALPVSVELEAFSPFVPLAARDSAWPATVLHYHVHNNSDQHCDIALGAWLSNPTYHERLSAATVRRVTTLKRGDDVVSIVHRAEAGDLSVCDHASVAHGLPQRQVIQDFSSTRRVDRYTDPDYPQPCLTSAPFTVNQPYLLFQPRSPEQGSTTQVALVVDTMVVRTFSIDAATQPVACAWDVREFTGHQAHVVVTTTPSGHKPAVLLDSVTLTNQLPSRVQEFSRAAMGFGTVALSAPPTALGTTSIQDPQTFAAQLDAWAQEKNATFESTGGLVQRAAVAPGESVTLTFCITWHFPNVHTGRGRMYANWFTDAHAVARQLICRLPELTATTRLFCATYYRATTLPWWLLERVMMPNSYLATGTAQWWRNGRFWGWEGVGCCPGTCTHVWNYAQGHARLFPELARSARRMQDLAAGLSFDTGVVGFRGSRDYAADGQAGTLLKCYREHLCAADDGFLRTHWPQMRLALDFLIAQDPNEDGLIEGTQHNTFDINFESPNTFVGSLYLAALRACEQMAHVLNDAATARRCRTLFHRGRENTVQRLFNGDYFHQEPMPPHVDWQYNTGCLSDQLFGQNWAHQLDLGYLYPAEYVRQALGAVYRYNFAPRTGAYNEHFPPERAFVTPDDAGLLICTWPHGERPREPVRYRDEVWTGIEYQVASHLIAEDRVDEALVMLKAIHDRYSGANHNPYNEVECGDHYARALASWGVLLHLSGFVYDGPAGLLGLAPRLHEDDFACFFSAAEGWGTLRQRVDGHAQINEVDLAWGHLRLARLRLQHAAPFQKLRIAAEIDGHALDASCRSINDWTELEFETPLQLIAGQTVRVTAEW